MLDRPGAVQIFVRSHDTSRSWFRAWWAEESPMRVLVVGSGGREHALCWAISGSPLLTKLYCAPGNPGIAAVAECVNIGVLEIPTLVSFVQDNSIDLVVPG